MKRLVVGAAHQGKKEYVNQCYGADAVTIYGLHLLVRQLMEQGKEPQKVVLQELGGKDSWIVICDEIGNGIVPADPFLRKWREETGRLCCILAAQADTVERISCGLPQRLKG